MSFKEFIQSHTGRSFFDGFAKYVSLFQELVAQLTALNQHLEIANAAQQQAMIAAVVAEPIPEAMPCIGCQEMVSIEDAVGITFRGETALLCANCAKEKDIIHDQFPLN
jgi:hypothetical protein